ETGDEIQIKAARENWLRISENLRRFDLALEQSRRDSGDLIPKEAMIRLAYEVQQALHWALFALEDVCPHLVGLTTPREVWTILERQQRAITRAIQSYLARDRKDPIPQWLLKAFSLGEFPLNPEKEEEQIQAFAKAMSIGMQAIAADSRYR